MQASPKLMMIKNNLAQDKSQNATNFRLKARNMNAVPGRTQNIAEMVDEAMVRSEAFEFCPNQMLEGPIIS